MDWDRAVNVTFSPEMQKSLLHMKSVTKSLCHTDSIINNLVLKDYKRTASNATGNSDPKEHFKEDGEINLKRNILEEKIINLKNQLRNKQQMSSAMEGKLSSYRNELKILASRANKLKHDTEVTDNKHLLFKQKLKLLKEESSELVKLCDHSRSLLKQFMDSTSESKDGTVIALKECCSVVKSNKFSESHSDQLSDSIETLTEQLPLMQSLKGGKLLLKQYFLEMTSTLTGTEALGKKKKDEKVLENKETNFNILKMKCIHHHIKRKSWELKVLKHQHNLKEISNQILCLIMVNTLRDQEHVIRTWLTLNLRNEVSKAMEMAKEELLSSTDMTKVDVDYLKLKILALEKKVLDLHSECDNFQQIIPRDLKSSFKSFGTNLDRVSRLYKGKLSDLINLDKSLKTTKEILNNNKDKYLLEFSMPFSSLTLSTEDYQHQFLEAYGVGNSIPLYSAHCTALNIIKMKQLFTYLCKEQPMSVISVFKNTTLPSNNQIDKEAFKIWTSTTEEAILKSKEIVSVLWEHPFSKGLPEQILVKNRTPKQWMLNYSLCLENIP